MDVVDLPDPVPGDGEVLYDISSGVKFADTHHPASRQVHQPRRREFETIGSRALPPR